MKNKIRLIRRILKNTFHDIKFILKNKKIKIDVPYNDLAPTKDADRDGTYSRAILWALENPDVYNIAITGADGSGKSSVLKSFFYKNKNRYQHINISLAKFNSYKDNEREIEQAIEKSILQQLFYSVDSKQIPFSRFKKISKISRFKIWLRSLILISTIYIYYFFNHPNFYSDMVGFFQENRYSINYLYFLLVVFTLFISYIISFLFIYILKGLRISNISFKNNQIEIKKNDVQSIFNKYIDEIVYFFEEMNYEVVIFEDLDRFKSSTKIFVKIRELNNILNLSKKNKNGIKFIYAVKDDLFIDSMEKNKFFDFIIPVVPINTLVNMPQEIFKLCEQFDLSKRLELSKDYLNDMALFIPDRRTLNNVINEFYIYIKKYQKVPLRSFEKHLFSLIVYKNYNPSEFSKMIFNEGIICNIINNKNNKIKDEKAKLQELLNRDLSDNQQEQIRNEIIRLDYMTISELLNRYGLKGIVRDKDRSKYEDELFFIKYGYIDESYLFYLSYFAEGLMSQNDINFYLNVKGHRSLYSYWFEKLDNISHLIRLFRIDDFRLKYILNYDLLVYLLKYKDKYRLQLEMMAPNFSRDYTDSESFAYRVLAFTNGKNHAIFQKVCDYLEEYLGQKIDPSIFVETNDLYEDEELFVFIKPAKKDLS